MDLTLYPTTVGDAPRILLTAILQRDFVSTRVVRAWYHLLGYGLGQVYPDLPAGEAVAAVMDSGVVVMTEDQLKEHLEMLCNARPMAVGAFPWMSLILTILPLIQDLIKRR